YAALRAAATRAGVTLVPAAATAVTGGTAEPSVTGVTTANGDRFDAGVTVLAAGAWSARLAGLPAGAAPPVRPVKRHTVRASVKGNAIYIVPRADGEIVLGASSDEAGFDVRPRAGAVYELLRDA